MASVAGVGWIQNMQIAVSGHSSRSVRALETRRRTFEHAGVGWREQNLIVQRNWSCGVVYLVGMEAWAASWQLSPSLLRARALLYWIFEVPYSHDHPEKTICLFVPWCRHQRWSAIQAQPEYVV